jgi:hypothetical protein
MMPVRFQLDSGETCNIITTHALTELGIRDLTKTIQVLKMYTNTTTNDIHCCVNMAAFLAVYSVHRYKSYYFNITEIVAVIISRWCAYVL